MLQVCQNIQNNGWKSGWIDDQGAPYAYGGDQWVGYDNTDSIKMKVGVCGWMMGGWVDRHVV